MWHDMNFKLFDKEHDDDNTIITNVIYNHILFFDLVVHAMFGFSWNKEHDATMRNETYTHNTRASSWPIMHSTEHSY